MFKLDADLLIISGLNKKDEKAFCLLVERYGPLIKAVVSRHLSGTMYTEECINDCLLAVWQNISRYDPGKNSLKNWIAAVCKYKCIDYLRRHYRESCLCPLTEDIPFEDCSEAKALAEELLAGLKPADRRLFYDHYIEGESVVSIAKRTDSSPDRLYNRLSLGRRRMQKYLKESKSYEK